MRKLPIGIQSFEKLRVNDYLYIDKTQYIWNLLQSGSVYFLSRPRRFGKSLLISTLEAYFQGKKELFHGLYIEEKENQKGQDAWTEYPVIRFSLAGGEYNSTKGLTIALTRCMEKAAEQYGVSADGGNLPDRLVNLIENLNAKTGKQVVVLVDEYDKPLLETMIVNKEQEDRNRELFKGFFSILKDEDQYLKFVFFTGVTKFSQVSIFSDLNQLMDISLDLDCSVICGITQEELEDNFQDEIQTLADAQNLSRTECLTRLKKMYDGYHFYPEGEGVYNPFSLLNAFRQRDFGSYWFETGTPTFLIRALQKSHWTPRDLDEGVYAAERDIRNYRSDSNDLVPLLYQSGYLTISGYKREYRMYRLSFPNDEVKYGFLNSLLPAVIHKNDTESSLLIMDLSEDLNHGDVDAFFQRLSAIFATIPYIEGQRKTYEEEWRNEMFLLMELIGQNVTAEKHLAKGRADCIVETDQYVYIFEFKVDQSADAALRQIEEKGYARPYAADSRKVYKIGVNFSSEKRNVEEWKIER